MYFLVSRTTTSFECFSSVNCRQCTLWHCSSMKEPDVLPYRQFVGCGQIYELPESALKGNGPRPAWGCLLFALSDPDALPDVHEASAVTSWHKEAAGQSRASEYRGRRDSKGCQERTPSQPAATAREGRVSLRLHRVTLLACPRESCRTSRPFTVSSRVGSRCLPASTPSLPPSPFVRAATAATCVLGFPLHLPDDTDSHLPPPCTQQKPMP